MSYVSKLERRFRVFATIKKSEKNEELNKTSVFCNLLRHLRQVRYFKAFEDVAETLTLLQEPRERKKKKTINLNAAITSSSKRERTYYHLARNCT